jgi:hypothetical protein
MYREISDAMKGILGKDLDLQFVTSPPKELVQSFLR